MQNFFKFIKTWFDYCRHIVKNHFIEDIYKNPNQMLKKKQF